MSTTAPTNVTADIDLWHYHTPRYACEIFGGLTALCGIVANIIIIYTLAKFTSLHRHPYPYILNLCISNVLYLFFAPTLFEVFGVIENVTEELSCLMIDQLFIHNVGNMVFVSIMTLDWYMTTYYSQTGSSRCRQFAKFIIITAWVVMLAFSLISVVSCLHGINLPVTIVLLLFSHFFVIVLVAVVNLLRLIKLKSSSVVVVKSKLSLLVANAYVLCWLPNWIFMYIWFASKRSNLELEILTDAIGYLSAVVLFIVLYNYDATFKSCIRTLCKCTTRQIEMETYKSDHRENQAESLIGQ